MKPRRHQWNYTCVVPTPSTPDVLLIVAAHAGLVVGRSRRLTGCRACASRHWPAASGARASSAGCCTTWRRRAPPPRSPSSATPPTTSRCIGLRVCPDLDTVMYTLGGGIHEGQGWGRAGETFTAAEEFRAYGEGPDWFTLGDRDLATHVVRTRLLGQGRTALGGHRRAVRTVEAARDGRAAAADERRPGRDARGDRRPGRRAGRPARRALPGVVGAPARRRPGPAHPGARHRDRAPGARRARRHPDGGRRPAARPATRSCRSGRSSACRGSATRCGARGPPSSGSPRSSGAHRYGGWPTPA